MWIKICANTNVEDAMLAAELGADALGFVFAPSSRRVTPEQAASISEQLPANVERIGVFDTHDAEEIVRTVDRAHLTGVQLHGGFDSGLIRRLAGAFGSGIQITQTLHWEAASGGSTSAETLRQALRELRQEDAVQRVLIDSRVGAATGGTGVAFDWKGAAQVLREELGSLRLIVAGGLNPENVEDAIQSLDAWGVDVATGVEAASGKKDPKKLEAFVEKASGVSLRPSTSRVL